LLRWTCGPQGSSDENCTDKCWKGVKMVKGIFEDPHFWTWDSWGSSDEKLHS
jgi:hypothetical protein